MNNPLALNVSTKPGDKKSWGNLNPSAQAFAIAHAALTTDNSTLIVTESMSEAERLTFEISLFLSEIDHAPTVELFPDWETLPYDSFSPHQDIISDRIRCLYNLAKGHKSLVIASAQTLAQRLAPQSYILSNSLVVKLNEHLDREKFRQQLNSAGYQTVDTVYQHGEFAVRGSLIDIYPMGSKAAYRIELFDDEVDSLREFDPETQRTIQQVKEINLLAGKECPLNEASLSTFRDNWHQKFDSDPKQASVYLDVNQGISPAGIEYFLPLFFESNASLLDYLPSDSIMFVQEKFEATYEDFYREASNRYESRKGDIRRPLLAPHDLFIPVNELYSKMRAFARVTVQTAPFENEAAGKLNLPLAPNPSIEIDNRATNPYHRLENFLYETNKRVLFCAESSGRREIIKEHLAKMAIEPVDHTSVQNFLEGDTAVGIAVANIANTINFTENLIFIAEAQLFGTTVRQSRRRKESSEQQDAVVKNLTELKIGAPVVHLEHGVGRYLGLQSIEHDGSTNEFLVLEYANDAKLYVPVTSLNLISRYSGSEESRAPLNKLGSESWQKAKRKAAEQIRDVAAELLNVYAKRQAKQGFAHLLEKDAYSKFCAGFPFEETPDQETAITAVRQDMLSNQPMDRLVCGDVGFGKTEVAMRAAFIAVQNKKQVAVLVPTTLLAQQHYENFKDRFADWPINIDVVSRFKSSKDIAEAQRKLETGGLDIIIGTHKLIQGDLKFNNLGLMIIDEEHRFGVRQKEALKALRTDIDILTMTATPIPRTLNMSMAGIRDLSIIATPPAKRLSIKTFVRESDDNVIKEAILREIMRGGQVYYLHNEVKDIEKVGAKLQKMVPEARIQIGHGQMRERELEAVMSDFYHKRFNLLLCTTIIETGIDVPSANTIIIDRADRFGLAQLHQLRGRVGRSHHQAYAYMLTPNKRAMTPDAHKRLDAIAEAQDLGAGFMLASHDLEIRGAGELLGDEQSGQMQTIGFSLYMDMLDKAVKAIQKGEKFDPDSEDDDAVEMNLRVPAIIPEDYLPDINTRLTLYKRIASAKNDSDIDDLQVEMIDRFGLLPDQVKFLMRQTRLRFFAETLGITKVEAGAGSGKIEFAKDTKVEPLTIVKLVQTQPQNFRLDGATQLKFTFEMQEHDQRLKTVHQVLEKLAKAG